MQEDRGALCGGVVSPQSLRDLSSGFIQKNLKQTRPTVTLISISDKESKFITELARDHELEVRNLDGTDSSSELSPACKQSFVVKKVGGYGPFLGCSRFPRCSHTSKVPGAKRRHAYVAGAGR